MNNNNFINFKKERELGDILSDSFKFLRENYKALFKVFVKYVGPIYLLQLFALGFYSYTTLDGIGIFSATNPTPNFGFSLILSFLFLMLAAVVYQAFMYGALQHAIRSYIKNNGVIKTEDVGEGMNRDWLLFIGLAIAISVMIFIGALFCFLPGIYLAVVLSLVYSVRTFESLSFSETISQCFSLIKNNWWITFFTLFVMAILLYLVSVIFQLPALIYSLTKGITMAQEGSMSDPSSMFDWVYLTLSIVASALQNLIFGLMAITIGFIYFNLNEKHNHTGTFEAIDNLGNNRE